MSTSTNTWRRTLLLESVAYVYVLTGVCQPLLLTVGKTLGVADLSAQLYLLFYYMGPSLWIFQVMNCCASCYGWSSSGRRVVPPWPARHVCLRAIALAVVDGFAQGLNYTGSTLAGPTLFAIVYSSLTVWTAVWARIVLDRRLSLLQWMAVAWVFVGLTVTAWDSVGGEREEEAAAIGAHHASSTTTTNTQVSLDIVDDPELTAPNTAASLKGNSNQSSKSFKGPCWF